MNYSYYDTAMGQYIHWKPDFSQNYLSVQLYIGTCVLLVGKSVCTKKIVLLNEKLRILVIFKLGLHLTFWEVFNCTGVVLNNNSYTQVGVR